MDRNNDGVVTIDEFIESCQKVCKFSMSGIGLYKSLGVPLAFLVYFFLFSTCFWQDENIMQSMQLFDNVI